jgi:tRNA nucleotidyltransferase/poly(A) polymerase
MSDYMFMLESHLNADQNRAVAELQAAANQANVNLFLAGGAMRDMLGGFPLRDLDFVVEGNALKVAKAAAEKAGAHILSIDEGRRVVEMVFPGAVTAEVGMSRTEKYAKPGAKPQVASAFIQDDLRRRDLTINAIALSLNRGSRGLLIDPTNGLADLTGRELRATNSYVFYEDPARLLRLVRFRARFGFTVEERTQRQYDNAREAQLEKLIPGRTLFEELRNIAEEPNAGEIMRELEQTKLLGIFSEALAGPKLSVVSIAKLEKMRKLLPAGNGIRPAGVGPFLFVLTEKLTPRERTDLIRTLDMRKTEVDLWQKLEPRAKKLEQALKSARLRQPSHVYQALIKAPGDELLFLLYRSQQRTVQDRLRNYLQKYYPTAQEVTDADVEKAGGKPGTPKYLKLKEELIVQRLNTRKKPAPPPPPVLPAGPGRPGGPGRPPGPPRIPGVPPPAGHSGPGRPAGPGRPTGQPAPGRKAS